MKDSHMALGSSLRGAELCSMKPALKDISVTERPGLGEGVPAHGGGVRTR